MCLKTNFIYITWLIPLVVFVLIIVLFNCDQNPDISNFILFYLLMSCALNNKLMSHPRRAYHFYFILICMKCNDYWWFWKAIGLMKVHYILNRLLTQLWIINLNYYFVYFCLFFKLILTVIGYHFRLFFSNIIMLRSNQIK